MSRPMKKSDPAYWMLEDEFTTTPTVYRAGCYICDDPEFAQMGLPLCKYCPKCKVGHVAADDTRCDDCGFDVYDAMMREEAARERQRRRVSDRKAVQYAIFLRKRNARLDEELRAIGDRLRFNQSLKDDWSY